MKKITLLFSLLFTISICAQVIKSDQERNISGFILHENKPLPNVNIFLEGEVFGTVSSKKGFFSIKAKTGDIIVFRYLGLKTIKIFVEDVTSTLNLTMVSTEKELPELIVESKLKKDPYRPEIVLGQANININKFAFGLRYLPGNKLNIGAITIIQAMRGKFPGMRIIRRDGQETLLLRGLGMSGAPLWDVDGMVTKTPPNINPQQIEHIAVINSLAGTFAYGNDASGGVILISTKSDYRNRNLQKDKEDFYKNNDFYNKDAVRYNELQIGEPLYILAYNEVSNTDDALQLYKTQKIKHEDKNNFHLDIVNLFNQKYNDRSLVLHVLKDFENYAKYNVEDLKSIAYKYQEMNELENSIRVYKQIGKLRPNHAQTFRDIANAYLELGQHENAWKIYKFYFNRGFKIEENDIGDILNSEMVANYIKLKEKEDFKEIFKVNPSKTVIQSDVRFVFEWNTTEAEFALEFVNSENRAYREENSLRENNDLIINQKKKGYTSKEYFIEKFDNGEWFVNINYLGNKKYKPTVLKLTTYYNWGRPHQTKKIKTYDLKLKNTKTKLVKIDRNGITSYAKY